MYKVGSFFITYMSSTQLVLYLKCMYNRYPVISKPVEQFFFNFQRKVYNRFYPIKGRGRPTQQRSHQPSYQQTHAPPAYTKSIDQNQFPPPLQSVHGRSQAPFSSQPSGRAFPPGPQWNSPGTASSKTNSSYNRTNPTSNIHNSRNSHHNSQNHHQNQPNQFRLPDLRKPGSVYFKVFIVFGFWGTTINYILCYQRIVFSTDFLFRLINHLQVMSRNWKKLTEFYSNFVRARFPKKSIPHHYLKIINKIETL